MELAEQDVENARLRAQIDSLVAVEQAMRAEASMLEPARYVDPGRYFPVPIRFPLNSAVVPADDVPQISRFADMVSRYYPSAIITVAGYSDPSGTPAYNKQLSVLRAEAVRALLVSMGVSPEQVRIVGYGATHFVTSAEGNEPGAEANRRVVFVIESQED